MRSVSCDVVVVGAGPAGSFAAAELAMRGWDVALADENETPRRDIVCSGIVGAEAFQRYDLPWESVVDVVRRGRFVSPSGLDVAYDPPDPPLAYVVDRQRFDAALTDRATSSGAALYRGHAARAVRRGAGSIAVEARTRNGPGRFVGRALVVATGHRRWLHEPAGLGLPPAYVHGVHIDVPFTDLDAAEVYFGRDVSPGYFAWAAPYGAGRARLGLLAPQRARSYFDAFVRSSRIGPRLGGDHEGTDRPMDGSVHGLAEIRLKSRGIVQGAVRPSFADRAVAVGEAAGQVKTTTAGGIYYGLIGAETAAEVLDEGLRDDRLDRAFLQRYETRWWGRLGREIESGLELQRLGGRVDDPDVDELFAALNNGLGSTVRHLVRFDWHRPVLRELFRHDRIRRFIRGRAGIAVGQR